MERKRDKVNHFMADFLEIPRDLVLNLPKLTVIGAREVFVENHRGIMEYQEDRIRINLARGYLEITGSDLEIKAILPDEMSIIGLVRSINFVE
ncbi:MAG: sporulation protein YqfC [Methylocystaceae bacterium]